MTRNMKYDIEFIGQKKQRIQRNRLYMKNTEKLYMTRKQNGKAEYSDKLILISSGMLVPKKENGSENIYLNYGLLGLGTILKQNGFDVVMYQGDYKAPEEIYHMIKDKKGMVLLSVPSFLAVEWAVRFTALIHDRKIVCGGRWVIDNNHEWIKQKLPYVDFFSFGCPDDVIHQLVIEENWKKFENISLQYTKTFDRLDYTILYNFKEYQPVIEICISCGSGCEFCLEKNFLPCRPKSAEKVIAEYRKSQHFTVLKD